MTGHLPPNHSCIGENWKWWWNETPWLIQLFFNSLFMTNFDSTHTYDVSTLHSLLGLLSIIFLSVLCVYASVCCSFFSCIRGWDNIDWELRIKYFSVFTNCPPSRSTYSVHVKEYSIPLYTSILLIGVILSVFFLSSCLM